MASSPEPPWKPRTSRRASAGCPTAGGLQIISRILLPSTYLAPFYFIGIERGFFEQNPTLEGAGTKPELPKLESPKQGQSPPQKWHFPCFLLDFEAVLATFRPILEAFL